MKNKLFLITTLLIILSLLLSGCGLLPFIRVVRGSGSLVSDVRPVSGFDRIQLDGAGQLLITQGNDEFLEVTAEDNLIEKLTSEVVDGTLVLGFEAHPLRRNIIPTRRIVYTLSVTELTTVTINGAGDLQITSLETPSLGLVLNGAGQIKINDLQAESLDVQISGTGNIDIAGDVNVQVVSIDGAANYQAGGLRTDNTTIEIKGLGNAAVWATSQLNVTLSGAGNLEYYGSPSLAQDISGAGNITGLGDK